MNSARVVTPGTGFRSLDDVPDGACVALDGRHLNYYYDEWVSAIVEVRNSGHFALVKSAEGHATAYKITAASIRKIKE